MLTMSLPILSANAIPNLLRLSAQYDLQSPFGQNKAHHFAYPSYHCSHAGRVKSVARSPRLLGLSTT